MGNCFGKRERFSGVDPSLVKAQVRSVGELSCCGVLEVSVCWKMVCFVRDSVEVIDDFGGSGGLEPVGGKTHIVDASLGRLPVVF